MIIQPLVFVWRDMVFFRTCTLKEFMLAGVCSAAFLLDLSVDGRRIDLVLAASELRVYVSRISSSSRIGSTNTPKLFQRDLQDGQ